MVVAWRKAFCTSNSSNHHGENSPTINHNSDRSPGGLSSRFSGFFSNPSSPRLRSQPVISPHLRCRTTVAPPPNAAVQSPNLHCKASLLHGSAPSSPRSPSTFDLIKSNLRLVKRRCRICLHGLKAGRGTAVFTAECGHSFHFPCISAHVTKRGSVTCPACNFTWKRLHLSTSQKSLPHETPSTRTDPIAGESAAGANEKKSVLKVYNDDEPLSSPNSGARFNPIPESDENEEENIEFPADIMASDDLTERNVEVALLSDTAAVSVGKTSETYAVVLRLKAPAAPACRAPIDLVTVLNVGRCITHEKLHLIKTVMRTVVSSLTAADRLSIVAFSTASRRLLPLCRMTIAGRRSARRIVDAIVSLDGGASDPTDAIRKAAKVIDDRRQKNPTASILLFSDGGRSAQRVSSTRFSPSDIPLHSVNLSACRDAPPEDNFAESVIGLLSEVTKDLKVQLGFAHGSAPAEISAVYSYTGRPGFIGSGSSWCSVGDFNSNEEKELLIELKVPPSFGWSRRILTVECAYKDPSTHQTVHVEKRSLSIPCPCAVGSSMREIQRLRCLFVTTRAVADSRRLAERNDIAGALRVLAAARPLVLQSGSGEEFVRGLEAELAELKRRRLDRAAMRRRNDHERAEEKAEPLTPTSAWRAAERLAKVAVTRKSLNRISDLHGFEDARF